MQYSFVRGAPSQPPLFTWESLHYLILELPPLRPSDSSSDSVVLARISHRIECIEAANQRKSLCRNNLSPTHGAPRCRQSVPRISSNLHPSKDAKWSPRSTLVQ